ncbi:amidase [Tropicimonas sediminicola]|uniref:Aspartyl-tRNA(Asn)/glutamyl-tRNA(Gln) amidotransferase subunit A n=1 Tax=Tropicimonas sediminicola TaxID=1031541 RepID=A0A239LCY2_9RHOB|nr:amidase [Tropicimonas sediminicola]SNT27703.1 aspartyl-tRNA(Asn)/glutamyl-tRNA(Gln) amidotransferase subunit A [Tropicimonas sediminicola]
MTSDLAFLTIREIRAAFSSGELSPVDLLDDVLARLEVLEPRLNTFAYTDFDGARAAARAAEDRLRKRQALGPLDGIPTSIKDLIAVRGMPQRFGSRASSEDAMTVDAPASQRLRAAGAVILGKSTTSEFGCKAVGDSPLTGITRNPWNTDTTPGGSSAGAASMVAAGLVPFAIGTDGGGSVRIPASLCGLFGIKAHFGRVGVYPTSATPTLAHVGPLARNVEDAAIALSVIGGRDRRDPFAVTAAQPDYVSATRHHRQLRRIAWSPTLGYARVDPEVMALTRATVERIAALGYEIEEVDHVMEDPIDLWVAEFYAGVGTRLRATIEEHPEAIDPAVLEVLRPALMQEMREYYQSVFARYDFRERMRAFFEEFDLLLSPTLPVPAFATGLDRPPGYEDKSIVSWASFTYPFNLTGQPAASIPAGFTSAGLPVGLQAVSAAHDEMSILSLAAHLEADRPDLLSRRPPTVS